MPGRGSDAGADGGVDRLSVAVERVSRERVADAFGDHRGGVDGGLRQGDGELLAAVTAEKVVRSQQFLDRGDERAKHCVTDGVTAGID